MFKLYSGFVKWIYILKFTLRCNNEILDTNKKIFVNSYFYLDIIGHYSF